MSKRHGSTKPRTTGEAAQASRWWLALPISQAIGVVALLVWIVTR